MLLTNIFLLTSWTAAALAWSSQHDQQVLLPPIPGDRGRTPSKPSRPFPRNLDFSLRHIYHAGSHKYPGLLRKVDVHADTVLTQDETSEYSMGPGRNVSVSSKPTRIERMADRSRKTINSILEAGRMTGQAPYLDPSGWTLDEIEGPNVTDKQTVLSFAIMAANAYITKPGDGTWEEAKGGFNYTEDFGWEQDGLRGHIFADTENSTIVIGLKGTSMAIFDGADTTGNDKDNDNLFGSCCCGQGGQYLWKQVCDCMTNTWTCNNTCLTKSLREKSHYYHAAMDLYHNVTERYPDADVWLTGHSLGGVVTALLGLTYGLPVVTFEAFPDALAASRLGLPTPPGYRIGRHQERNNTGVYHFGHTADPVFTGTCNTATSGCTIAGYAFESQCHTGSVCTYDTVGDLGWRVGVSTHRITYVVANVVKKYDTVPVCEVDEDCVDCYKWKFYESNGTETTTSASTTTTSSRSSTRTATCQTPGWWGCLDETTSSTTTETSTLTTTTCLTPGWFGCKDLATTTLTTTITTSAAVPAPTVTTIPTTTATTTETTSVTPTSTCETPGWFGCKDPTPTPTSSSSRTATKTKKSSSTTTCTSKEWFGFVCVDPSPDAVPKTDL
ncbi:lipase-like protein 2 [Elsinoe australis]|uniref:triacylglycerol lipase n=1 Tax=Elsinoe australis TaxID=40998 RepID=A0A4U7B4V8_9PEZI|nr:lipase-like protein 2 [Elsinoe australis]